MSRPQPLPQNAVYFGKPGVTNHAKQRLEQHYGVQLVPAAWDLVLHDLMNGKAVLVRRKHRNNGDMYLVNARYGDQTLTILVAYCDVSKTVITTYPPEARQTVRRQKKGIHS